MQKILVANRGEIALRIMRAAREMGISTVAVFSAADRRMPFVAYADEALCIGEGPSSTSYLAGDRILEAAHRLGADAIHPGYGFLSENAAFARQVQEAGLVFIGPPAEAMAMMGNKLAAKQAAAARGVPLVPGTDTPLRDVGEALAAAGEIGFPLLIKAAAGGGGKGMRVVDSAAALPEQLQLAKNEALNAFGDDAVFLERYIASSKHIEVQVLADQHGNAVHLFERECSIQRRHQKLIEEAPSSCLTPAMREQMGACALEVARACGYTSAGTVEFLVDAGALQRSGDLAFYFLEMNTRLQVEHPVTEWITGIDLVKEQIRIASGEPLGYTQQDLALRGHAIELRVCAEDPDNHFLPDTGTLSLYRRPLGPGVRVDDGYDEGLEVPIFYDPLLAKLVVWGQDREAAIARMVRAVDEYRVRGVRTTLSFGQWAVQHPAFRDGSFDTRFIEHHWRGLPAQDEETARIAALLAASWREQQRRRPPALPSAAAPSRWRRRRE